MEESENPPGKYPIPLPDFLLAKGSERTLPVLATGDQALAMALIKGGFSTAEQLETTHRYGEETIGTSAK